MLPVRTIDIRGKLVQGGGIKSFRLRFNFPQLRERPRAACGIGRSSDPQPSPDIKLNATYTFRIPTRSSITAGIRT